MADFEPLDESEQDATGDWVNPVNNETFYCEKCKKKGKLTNKEKYECDVCGTVFKDK
ncbi:MAG: hypothetical protein Q8O89_04770 [Nanoarchaeota archaeon]|nr:hypothetical protein [Nanoarchaeota archaeon]